MISESPCNKMVESAEACKNAPQRVGVSDTGKATGKLHRRVVGPFMTLYEAISAHTAGKGV